MSNLTLKEIWAIENIISAERTGNNYRLPRWTEPYEQAYTGETWSLYATLGGGKHGEKTDGKAFSAVCSSLVQKGYAFSGGSGKDQVIGITKKGWEAYQAWAGENLKAEG